jgi:hypothetical protein
MEEQKIRFDKESRDLMLSCMDELRNDTIKNLAENIQGASQDASAYSKLTVSYNFCKASSDIQSA